MHPDIKDIRDASVKGGSSGILRIEAAYPQDAKWFRCTSKVMDECTDLDAKSRLSADEEKRKKSLMRNFLMLNIIELKP